MRPSENSQHSYKLQLGLCREKFKRRIGETPFERGQKWEDGEEKRMGFFFFLFIEKVN